MLIYSTNITERLRYIVDFIFSSILAVPFEITNDKEKFITCRQPKINYSSARFGEELFIKAHAILFEENIVPHEIVVSEWKGTKVFFQTTKDSFLPFDIFAASFFLISRYEEYLPFVPDKHGRFSHEQSLAFRKHFLQHPVVDIWAMKMGEELLKHIPGFSFGKRKFCCIPTIDVDNAYAIKHKGLIRLVAMIAKSLFLCNFRRLYLIRQVLTGKIPDPYDNYDYIYRLHQEWNCNAVFFFPVGSFGKHDRNISLKNAHMQTLLLQCRAHHSIGIHPSYAAAGNTELLRKEIQLLRDILSEPLTASRQHYLRILFPFTYMQLHEAGITEDYSMGYSTAFGFRAGTCTPFSFFNLKENKKYSLTIYSFQVMDVVCKNILTVKTGECLEIIFNIIDDIKETGGVFIPVWHNENMLYKSERVDMKKIYELMLMYALGQKKRDELLNMIGD